MLKAIFYARFHPEKGSTVLHQVPEGSIIPTPSPSASPPLFDYQTVADYIIPRREFCDRLVSITVSPLSPHSSSASSSSHHRSRLSASQGGSTSPRHRIIGFPVCIHDDEKYSRNDFIFNFCVVVEEDVGFAAYCSIVGKLARLFRNLEEMGGFLSEEEEKGGMVLAGEVGYGGGSKVYALCEMILEDLNNYCECMIPIDESNTINLKLFPTRSPPPPIHTWHVPLSLVSFPSLTTSTWDLTVQRLLPHINGVNSVARIATISDTDLTLTRRAISHLLYYGCICLLDIFQFSAVYAPTAEIAVFFTDTCMQDECRYYISSPHSPFGKTGGPGRIPAPRSGSRLNPANADSTHHDAPSSSPPPEPPSRATVLDLYASLRQSLTLRDWCLLHSQKLVGIDIRRFITFGKIKGFLYRSHRYAIALRPTEGMLDLDDPIASARAQERAWRKAAMSSGWTTPKHEVGLGEMQSLTADAGAENGNNVEGEIKVGGEALAPGDPGVGMRRGGGGGAGGGGALDDALGLARYLDGLHSLDEICTDQGLNEREVVRKLKGIGDVAFIYR